MKRLLSLVLITALCLGFSVFAEDAKNQPQNASKGKLSYNDIETQMLKNNQTILSGNLTLQMLEKNDMASSAQSALWNVYTMYSGLSNQLNNASFTATDPDAKLALQGSKAALDLGLMSISQQMSSMNTNPETIVKTKLQLEMAEKQIIWGAKSLFMAYHSLAAQKKDLEATLTSTAYTIKHLEQRYALGQIAALDLDNAKGALPTINSGIATLENEMKNLTKELNILLGRSHTSPLSLNSLPAAETDFMDTLDSAKNLATAKANNYNLKLKKKELEDAEKGLSSKSDASYLNRDSVKLQYQLEENKLDLAMFKLENGLKEKQRLVAVETQGLALEEKNLMAAKKKFELGMTAQADYKKAEDSFAAKQSKIAAARQALFMQQEQYKLALAGIITTGN